ncbi:MAG: peptide chain release factor 2 [Gemmatales bacterium]|nr:peptide chain release factor 2 [Gemmatales bacterium]MDW8221362.1 peptide chain release factor 2 [Gemmatales bacterium]
MLNPELQRRVEELANELTKLRDSLDIPSKLAERARLEAQMSAPGFWDNPEKAQRTIAELKPLNALLKPYEELERSLADLQALVDLTREDPSLEGELQREVHRVGRLMNEFQLQAMLRGKFDACSAYVRIQAGAGGTDACDWAQMLLRMYKRWAERHSYEVQLVDEVANEEGGIRNATLFIEGDYAYGWLQGETGVHRLVRISPFDAEAKRHTSFAAVDVMPEIEETPEITIRRDEVERQTFCAGGPGGQHQNKTQSGVRLIHIPTGIVAECRSERSQHRNEEMAWKILRAKLLRLEEQKRRAEIEKKYDEKGEVAWGYQIRNYILHPYTLVKDVRTGVQTAQVQRVLDGELDEFLEAYLRQKTEKEHRKPASESAATAVPA